MTATVTPVAIGLGSNLDNRLNHLVRATEALCALNILDSPRFSPIYETAAVDCPDPRPFLNATVGFDCHTDAGTLLSAMQAIETDLDRTRPYRHAPRTIDLDLLLFGETIIHQEHLIVPHPRFHQRLFVTTPLAHIAGDWRHPSLNATVSNLDAQLRENPQHRETPPRLHQQQWPQRFTVDRPGQQRQGA